MLVDAVDSKATVNGVGRWCEERTPAVAKHHHPEEPLVIPSILLVVNNSSPETSCWVNASASDWDCGQVYHEHIKSNGERCQNLEKLIPTTKTSEKKE